MNNVVNLKTPFLDSEGFPLTGGRVKFVENQTDGELIHIYAADGETELQNPLYLNELGTWNENEQPFVKDGISYKMVVEKDSGIPLPPPETGNLWSVVDEIVVLKNEVEIKIEGLESVDSVAELRTANPSVGKVAVLGYYSAGDNCPPRIFVWKDTLYTDNGGTRIRSTIEEYAEEGTWVLDFTGFVDIKWFGVLGNTDAASAIDLINRYHYGTPVYIGHNVKLGHSVTIKSARIDGATISPVDGNADVTFECDHIEVSSGHFAAYNATLPTSNRVIPIVKGELRTSWLFGSVNEFFTETMMDGLDRIVFDSVYSVEGIEEVELSGKRIVVYATSLPSGFSFSSCEVLFKGQGIVSAKKFAIEGSALTIEAYGNEFAIKNGNDNKLLVSANQLRILVGLKINDFEIDENNAFARYETGDDWDGLLALYAERSNIGELRSDLIKCENFEGDEEHEGDVTFNGRATFGTNVDFEGLLNPARIKGLVHNVSKDDDDNSRVTISDSLFASSDVVKYHLFDNYGGTLGHRDLVINAVPTNGRIVVVYYDNIVDVTRYLRLRGTWAGGTETAVGSVGANSRFALVADGTNWNIDFFRI